MIKLKFPYCAISQLRGKKLCFGNNNKTNKMIFIKKSNGNIVNINIYIKKWSSLKKMKTVDEGNVL